MAGAWRALVLVVGLAAVACVAQRRQSYYEKLVTQALQFFNYGRQGQPLFGLLEALPPPSSEERNCTGFFLRLRRFRVLTVDCPGRQEVLREKRSTSPEAATSEIDSSKLPPVVRDMYEKAKFDIISNILRNF
ncbi:neutrophilic granule protein-like isoform 2-T2 [Molossus nigricans]